MRRILMLLLSGSLFVGVSAQAAASQCPPREKGSYPWAKNGTVKGDLWARVFIEFDTKGWPKRCLMGENNIDDSDRRFFICKSVKEDWRPGPGKDNRELASTTIERFFLIPGPDQDKRLREAKKRWLAEHPGERPECYAEN